METEKSTGDEGMYIIVWYIFPSIYFPFFRIIINQFFLPTLYTGTTCIPKLLYEKLMKIYQQQNDHHDEENDFQFIKSENPSSNDSNNEEASGTNIASNSACAIKGRIVT